MPLNHCEDPGMRSKAGLGEFQLPSHTSSIGDLQMGNNKAKGKDLEDFHDIDKRINSCLTLFRMTGFESEGMELVRRDHFIYYPRGLRLRSYPRGVLSSFPPPVKDQNGIPSWWLLDGGSVVPVLALGLEKGDSLLDICAAPGGKSLLSLLTMLPNKVVCNDFKLARLGMLKRALSTYIPMNGAVSDMVILKRNDASSLSTWNEFNLYDKVSFALVNFVFGKDDGNMFSSQMANERLNLPQLQTKILVNSLRSVKVGGSVVYSTCTLSSIQNEAVVGNAAAIADQKFGIRVIEESLSQLVNHLSSTGLYRFSDQCRTGALVLPYLPSNFGPMYVCKLTRLK
uniref:NOL1/NOP2/Sun domain family member 4 n=1 Tax=Angiostrongylus cantonensis TaxID=6313 RepID=A0A0K0DB62_ANGCA